MDDHAAASESPSEPKASEGTQEEAISTDTETATAPEAPRQDTEEVEAAGTDEETLDLRPGQTVRVHERIVDISPKGEERQRIQVFEGIILGVRGSGLSRTFTIRKVSGGVGVEKIFPVHSPVIAKIELVKTARVRRAKLTFLTNLRRRFKRKLKETYADS